MTLEELKIRQLTNQYLITPGDTLTVLRDLCGVQAQFMGNAIHSLKIRCTDFDAPGEGLVKNWTLRGTVHVFAEADLPVFTASRYYRCNAWTAPSWWNQRSDWALTPRRQQYLSGVILSALEQGPLPREELKRLCREQGMTEGEEHSMFDPWGGGIRQLCERGFLHYLAREEKIFALSPEFKPMSEEEAERELARRYFTNFGPATVHDAMYFFRTSGRQVEKWLSQLPVTACEWEGKTYYFIQNGKQYGGDIPRCLFLAGFDQLMLGYEKQESLYLKQDDLRRIFNLAGIVMPALLLDGEVAGKWKMKNGVLTVEPFHTLSREELSQVTQKVEVLWPELRKLNVLNP